MAAGLSISTSWWRLIDERAQLTPERPFLSDEEGRALTFEQYRERAEAVAAGLLALGVRPGQVVSWQLPTTMEASVLMAALCRLGVRQNPIIPILRRAEVGHIVDQLAADWLIVPGLYRGFDYLAMAREAVGDRACTIVDASQFARDHDLALPMGDPATLAPAEDPGDEVRWVYYSSGTTAAPKGIMHSDESVMAASNAQVAYLDLEPTDVFAAAFPITHIGGMLVHTAYLRVGSGMVFFEAFDPVRTPPEMAARGATILGSATPFFQAYLAAQRAHGDEVLFKDLRQLHAGGAPITPELNAECARVLGTKISNQWGLTEFPAATSLAVDDPLEKYNGTVGRVGPGAEVKVVDLDGVVCPPGAEGELWVRGTQLFKGYVDPALEKGAFDDDGFFRTGDLGTIDADGFVRITGRLKDIIIRNAENLSAQEIEDVLAEHPAIADVAVIGVPDERTGERACAVVVLADGVDTLTVADLAEHCQAHGLAKQKIPEQLELAPALPRNSMGKVLKHELRAEVLAR